MPRPFYAHSGKSRLYVSEYGRCPRRALLRVNGYQPSAPFAPTLLEAMGLGLAYETDTFYQLAKVYPNMMQQVVLGNTIWSGKCDALIPGQPATIVELKAANSATWDWSGKLPQHENVSQAWLYGELYKEQNHKPVIVKLFYRGWSKWAEFEVEADEDGDVVTCTGLVDGEPRTRSWEAGLGTMRQFMESHYTAGTVPDPACGVPRDDVGCTFQKSPSCGFYDQCWK
jgi:hypothetical protein